MEAPISGKHPFQQFNLPDDPYWKDVTFDPRDDGLFSGEVEELEALFQRAVREGGLLGFIRSYAAIAKRLLKKSLGPEIVRPVLINALGRLVTYHYFLTRRTRSNLNENIPSLRGWTVEPRMIEAAREQAARMEREGVAVEDVDLEKLPELKNWLMDTVRPVISGYVGIAAIKPWAQIRYADAATHGDGWQNYYKQHPYGYFHFDEFCYSIPTIIYLEDVDEECGPFSYVEGGDKMKQNYVLRAFHQAVGHDMAINPVLDEDRQAIGKFPDVFRGTDLVGTMTGPAPFENHEVKLATGKAGQVSMFEGFMLPHAGGHPKTKSRKALFVAFRYPGKRIGDWSSMMAEKYLSFVLS
jgi:hypothetical protein